MIDALRARVSSVSALLNKANPASSTWNTSLTHNMDELVGLWIKNQEVSDFPSYEELEGELWAVERQRNQMLHVLMELRDSVDYWSEYAVPLGIVDRIKTAIAMVGMDEDDKPGAGR